MTALLPTRISLYDFLYEDTLPIKSVFADIGNISIPQARILIQNGIQAIISALMSYNQALGSEAVLKKLLCRNQIKELRKYNAFNLKTMYAAYQNGNTINDALFASDEVRKQVYQKLAKQTDLQIGQVRHLLGALSLLCLREIAILADFAHLDVKEIQDWFDLQPQFFQLQRDPSTISEDKQFIVSAHNLPTFDQSWHEITGYKPPKIINEYNADKIPHYAKVIGRVKPDSPKFDPTNGQVIVDNSDSNNVLTFGSMNYISLPYQRWLLQLAKISDIYLSRKRLKIAPEPVQPPSRPLVNYVFRDSQNNSQNKNTVEDSASTEVDSPFWKNPVIVLLVVVLGSLSLLAVSKYHYKKSQIVDPTSKSSQMQAKSDVS